MAEIKQYVPPVVRNHCQLKELYEAVQPELDALREHISDTLMQCFAQSASYGLPCWEAEFGLPTNENLSDEERRRFLFEKQNRKVLATPQYLRDSLENLTGGTAEITECISDYLIEIKLEADGLLGKLKRLEMMLYELVPAHLGRSAEVTGTEPMDCAGYHATTVNLHCLFNVDLTQAFSAPRHSVTYYGAGRVSYITREFTEV